MITRGKLVITAALAALLTLLALPGAALAHAELLSTSPSAGAVLDASPGSVTLTFNEPVEISLGTLRLFDGGGNSVEVPAARHPSGNDKAVVLQLPALGKGSYVVDWQVVSADSHPVQGAFTFQIGKISSLQAGILNQIIDRDHTSRTASIGLAITRGVIIAAIAIVFGGLLAIATAIVDDSRRLRRVIAVMAGAGAVAGLLQLPLEVGYATGRSLSVIVRSDAWSAAFDSRIGTAWVIRAAIVAVLGAALLITLADRGSWWWRAITLGGLAAVGIVSAYGGHGATGRWIGVGVLATMVHVSAMAMWLGGLVALVLGFSTVTLAGARRFSAIALGAIVAVIASGVVQSIRQLGSIDALRNTHYGVVLVWKVVLVAVLLLVANVSRHVVRRRRGLEPTEAAEDFDRPRLRRAVTIEAVLAVAIVVATSMLMAANPSEVAASRPFSIQLLDGTYLAAVTIEPAHIGANELHIYLSSAESSLIEPDEVHVQISDPSRAVAAIDIPVTRSGASHYTTPAATFPYGATWTLLITARYNTFDEVQFTAKVPIR